MGKVICATWGKYSQNLGLLSEIELDVGKAEGEKVGDRMTE